MADKNNTPIPLTGAALNLKVLGSPDCDAAAMLEALRVIGYDAQGKPLDGKSAHYEAIAAAMPQIMDSSDKGVNGWSPKLDKNCNGDVSNLEVAAALIAASQLAVKHNKSLKDISVTEIADTMADPLRKFHNGIKAECSIRR